MAVKWRESPIQKVHNRKLFNCGESALNEYLLRFARQNHMSGGAKTFVATPADAENPVLGYYTLCPASLHYARTPEVVKQGLGRYDVPVYRLGRLAVDMVSQGRGLGGQLLIAAGIRCLRVASQAGGVAVLIDAKSDRAAAWYAGYGAIPLNDAPLSLLMPLSLFEKTL